MKVFLLALIIFSFSTAASKLNWNIQQEIGNTSIWRFRLDKTIFASTQRIKKANSKKYLSNKNDFYKLIEKKKQNALNLVGIKSWKADQHSWNDNELTITGRYVDRKGETVYFIEKQIYEIDKTLILLLTSDKLNKLDDSKILDFFNTSSTWEMSK